MRLYVYIWHIVHIYMYKYIYTLQISHIADIARNKNICENSWRSARNLQTRCFRPKVRMTMTTSPVVEEEWCLWEKRRVKTSSYMAPKRPQNQTHLQKRTESFRDVERFWDIAGVFSFGFWLIAFGLLVDCYLASFGWFLRWDLVVVKFGIRKEDNWKRRILRRRLHSGPLRWL